MPRIPRHELVSTQGLPPGPRGAAAPGIILARGLRDLGDSLDTVARRKRAEKRRADYMREKPRVERALLEATIDYQENASSDSDIRDYARAMDGVLGDSLGAMKEDNPRLARELTFAGQGIISGSLGRVSNRLNQRLKAEGLGAYIDSSDDFTRNLSARDDLSSHRMSPEYANVLAERLAMVSELGLEADDEARARAEVMAQSDEVMYEDRITAARLNYESMGDAAFQPVVDFINDPESSPTFELERNQRMGEVLRIMEFERGKSRDKQQVRQDDYVMGELRKIYDQEQYGPFISQGPGGVWAATERGGPLLDPRYAQWLANTYDASLQGPPPGAQDTIRFVENEIIEGRIKNASQLLAYGPAIGSLKVLEQLADWMKFYTGEDNTQAAAELKVLFGKGDFFIYKGHPNSVDGRGRVLASQMRREIHQRIADVQQRDAEAGGATDIIGMLTDESHPDYVGGIITASKYHRTPQEIMSDVSNAGRLDNEALEQTLGPLSSTAEMTRARDRALAEGRGEVTTEDLLGELPSGKLGEILTKSLLEARRRNLPVQATQVHTLPGITAPDDDEEAERIRSLFK